MVGIRPFTEDQAIASFWDKVSIPQDVISGCWTWVASLSNGYGRFNRRVAMSGITTQRAHRIAFHLVRGNVGDGLVLDHVCRKRACVNPAHLEPVSQGENLARGAGTSGAMYDRKTHCIRGHEFTKENTYRQRQTGRACRTCALSASRNENWRRESKELKHNQGNK